MPITMARSHAQGDRDKTGQILKSARNQFRNVDFLRFTNAI